MIALDRTRLIAGSGFSDPRALAQNAAQNALQCPVSPFADRKLSWFVGNCFKQLILLARFLPFFARIGPRIRP
jgi:hypothetical protein